jgi:hypothetical protein
MKGYTRYQKDFIKVYNKAVIHIRQVQVNLLIFIIKGADHLLILRQPFLKAAYMNYSYQKDRQWASL